MKIDDFPSGEVLSRNYGTDIERQQQDAAISILLAGIFNPTNKAQLGMHRTAFISIGCALPERRKKVNPFVDYIRNFLQANNIALRCNHAGVMLYELIPLRQKQAQTILALSFSSAFPAIGTLPCAGFPLISSRQLGVQQLLALMFR